MVLAAEYLGVRARWLLDGHGEMKLDASGIGPSQHALAQPALTQALPVVLDALASLPAARWVSVRAQLDQLVSHPEMRDDTLTELQALLSLAPGKRRDAA